MVTIHSPGEAFAGKGSAGIHSSGHIGGNRETLGGKFKGKYRDSGGAILRLKHGKVFRSTEGQMLT